MAIKDEDTDMSQDERLALVSALENYLDTRDKRWMFLKIEFPKVISAVDLEGAPSIVAWNIYEEFKKQNMRGSLIACLNTVFDLQLTCVGKKVAKIF